MLLSELNNNTQVEIRFSLNDKDFAFPVNILGSMKGFTLTEPIIVNNKVLNFDSNKVPVEIMLHRENDKPIVWSYVKIVTIHSSEGPKYCIKDCFGKEVNRRGAFRAFIGLSGSCQISGHKEIEDVLMRDISTSGFSFVTTDSNNIMNKQLCHINYKDELLGYSFSLNGTIERIQKNDNGDVILGCKLTKKYAGLDEYINIKQREQLARTSGMTKRFDYNKYKHLRIHIK